MSHREPREARALARLIELAREFPRTHTPAELDRGLSKVRARLWARKSRHGAGRTWLLRSAVAALGVALSALAIVWLRPSPTPPPKPVAVSRVEGGQLLQGGYLSESGAQGIQLFFDEGSKLALTPGGRARLRFDAGVRLLLERGSAALQITPTTEPRWAVESGPFLVTVKGTDFTVGWDPTSELFELTLRRGRVVVSGPVVGDHLALRPGQKLSVSLPKAETVITEERVTGPAPSTPSKPVVPTEVSAAEAPAEIDRRHDDAGSSSTPTVASSQPPRQWRSALANGDWDRIIAEAERGGLETTLEGATSDDLFALADAARYRRRLDVAQAALLAQRRRFPSSARAAEAIFLLGRVSELRSGGRAAALQRYDEYLARAPNGTYAAEALGRKMTLVNEVGGPARPIAEEYLRRFPSGSYARAARALLSVGD